MFKMIGLRKQGPTTNSEMTQLSFGGNSLERGSGLRVVDKKWPSLGTLDAFDV